MKEKISIKEHIISVTTELINEHGGNTESITARLISERAGTGLGLINYHFKTKENLITACVQRIIETVISGFRHEGEFSSDRERLTAWATYVFEFLFGHMAISRISILGDFQNYTDNCNSVYTQRGFITALSGGSGDKPMLSFVLTAAMQSAFLSGDTAKALLGYDFTKQADRYAFIEKLVSILFEGCEKEGNL